MTTRYVGAGGNDSNSGLSWALRKLTLGGVEATPVEAGDTVYVGAGVYRERLVCGVSGTSGSPITYIADYDGTHTDGTGGVVRITASADDTGTGTNDHCILIGVRNYRTFTGFLFEGSDGNQVAITTGSNAIIDKCFFTESSGGSLYLEQGTALTVSNCFFLHGSEMAIYLSHGSDTNSTISISNCIFIGNGNYCIRIDNYGDTTIKNCTFFGGSFGVRQVAAQEDGHPTIVNNCIFCNCTFGLYAVSTANITENYNTFSNCGTARTNVDVGAQSLAYPALFDARWFFELVAGGDILSPFDLASYSKIIDVAGTSPTTADMRGTTVQGTQREWGALEYDSTLDIEAGAGASGGSVKILPLLGRVGL